MPAENRLRLDDEQGLVPTLQPAREQNDARPISLRQARSFDRAVEHDELLAEQGVFDDQLRLDLDQVMDAALGECDARRLGPRPEMVLERLHAGRDRLLRPVQQLYEHRDLLAGDEPVVG